MKRLLLAALATLIAGCSTPSAHTTTNPALSEAGKIVLRMAIRRGVTEYIAKHSPTSALEKAARVKAVIDEVLLVINGESTTTLDALKAVALASISAELTPLEQQEARDVIELVALAIQGSIGDGDLDGTALVKVRDALDWISQAAATYGVAG